MKTILGAVTLAAMGFVSLPASAHSACDMGERDVVVYRHASVADQYEERIRRGLARGQLSRHEAMRLFRQLGELRELEQRIYRDGRLTYNEQRQLQERQAKLSYRLQRELNDGRERYEHFDRYGGHQRDDDERRWGA
jgi:hypothetical protein